MKFVTSATFLSKADTPSAEELKHQASPLVTMAFPVKGFWGERWQWTLWTDYLGITIKSINPDPPHVVVLNFHLKV
jgi:hypothetical protein